eukprot:10189330-Lingulodinium_polyedra.AAC.1
MLCTLKGRGHGLQQQRAAVSRLWSLAVAPPPGAFGRPEQGEEAAEEAADSEVEAPALDNVLDHFKAAENLELEELVQLKLKACQAERHAISRAYKERLRGFKEWVTSGAEGGLGPLFRWVK